MTIGGDDGVEDEYFEFEVVVGGQVAGHEGVYVGNRVAVAIEGVNLAAMPRKFIV